MGILILYLFDYNPPKGKRSGILGGLSARPGKSVRFAQWVLRP